MDVLLISPRYNYTSEYYFPWSIMSISSYLSDVKNYEVKILDANVESESEFTDKIRYYCKTVKLIGISMMSTDTEFVKNCVDYIKGINPNIRIIVGGPHAILQPEQTCAYKNIDFVAFGEGENTISLLLEKTKLEEDYGEIPGLIYKDGDNIVKTQFPKSVGFYNIDYDLFPQVTRKDYSEYIQVWAGRGCSYKCTFCYNAVCGYKWNQRAMVDIINEIENIMEKYNSKIINFRDDNFFHSKDRILEFIAYYKEKKFKFKWISSCRANYFNEKYINYKLMKELENINCTTLKFGLESGSQKVLNYLKKGIKIENVKKMICDIGKLKKIKPVYATMIGLPCESFGDYKKTLNLVKFIIKNNPSSSITGPFYFRIYPGGDIYEEIKAKYGYSEPNSFEEWAQKYSLKNNPFVYNKNINYPWVPLKHRTLVKYADSLVSLYRQDIIKDFKIRHIWQVFFIILAKVRMKYEWYTNLYDIAIYIYLRKIKKRVLGVFVGKNGPLQ